MACNACRLFSKSRIYQIAARRKPAIGDGVLWATPCKRRRSLKRSLEIAKPRAKSLGGSVVAIRTNPSSIHSIIDYRGYSNYPPQKQAPAIFAKAAFFIFKLKSELRPHDAIPTLFVSP